MSNEPSQAPIFSQIETREPRMRVVLLGASNLTLSFSKIIATARATFAQPLEFFVAMGCGRSYGQESNFFGKKFPGILQCEIWDALARAGSLPTVAVIADVGNDLAYGAGVATVRAWVTATLDRLAEHDARVVLNNLPHESMRAVGALRYAVLRTLLFPRSRVPRREMLSRAEALSRALAELAAERKIPVFSGEKSWYGFDPIHPRHRLAGAIWQRMIGDLGPQRRGVSWTSSSRADARLLRRLQAQAWSQVASQDQAPPPVARLSDGSQVALF